MPATEIGKRLGVCGTTAIRYAFRLRLEMNTPNSRTVQGYKRHQNPRLLFPQIKKNYRENFIRVQLKCPNLFRRELVKKAGFVYVWLRRNDSAWLEKQLPKSRKIGRLGETLDWNNIDSELSNKIKKACKEIKSVKEFPIRVSLAEIFRKIGNRIWIDKRHEKLPLTVKVIDKYTENLEDFMLRKVDWGKEFFIKNSKLPTLAQFKVKASVRNQTSENSVKIQQAVKNALEEIQSSIL
jgi:hypothetical protein